MPSPPPRPSTPVLGPPGKPPSKPALGDVDLPAPKAARPPAPGPLDLGAPLSGADLPAPKPRPSPLGNAPAARPPVKSPLDGIDLPAPKAARPPVPGPLDLDAHLGSEDVPAPKAKGGLDLEDLPAPRAKGGLDVSGPPAAMMALDAPSPSGFFDDLPMPKADSAAGFFDDLPMPSSAPKADATADATADGAAGFFDDLPMPSKSMPLSASRGSAAAPAPGLAPGLDLGAMPPPLGGVLDLGAPPPPPQGLSGGVDLATPATDGQGAQAMMAATFSTPSGAGNSGDLTLDLADGPRGDSGGSAGAKGASAKAKPKAATLSPAQIAARKRRTRLLAAGALGLALLGGVGAFMYQRKVEAQERADTIARDLAEARKQLGDSGPLHWQKAAAAAQKVLKLAPGHSAALGLAAEAAIAGALDDGKKFDARVAQGRKLAQEGLGAGKTSVELERAQAVMLIAANQVDRALPQLQTLLAKAPKDSWLHVYLGWAQLAKGDAAAALASFAAAASSAATKVPALYGQGKAKLLASDLEGARAMFAAVLEADKDHIGAQVSLAATLPPQQSAQREADLLAVLARPDIKDADPRVVVQAWTLVGDVARTTGRLDLARDHYRKALAIAATNIPALNGLTTVELRDGKPQVAADLNQKALTADPEQPEALLLAAQLEIAQGQLPAAETRLKALLDRQPPLPPLLRARVHVARGQLLEAQANDEGAIAEYEAGAKLAGDLDLTPTLAAVKKLSELASKDADPAKAEAFRTRAGTILASLATRAQEDADLSIALGVAYLDSGDPQTAEEHLRRAALMREKDPEARLQLARALSALGRINEATARLDEALAIDPKRNDVALELARVYQVAGRHDQAMLAYEKLLAAPGVPVVARVRAGRYFATRGAFDKAAAQAAPILKEEPNNTGGLYLKAEGQMLAGKWDDARATLMRVTENDKVDGQYLDALARALEGSYLASGETKFIEGARYNYERATKADPKLFHAHLGLGRMLLEGRNWDDAIQPLAAASQLENTGEVKYFMGLAFYGVRNQSPAHRKTAADWLEAALATGSELALEKRANAWWRLGQLYEDLNKLADAIRAQENATSTGEQLEKTTKKPPEWLTETYYDLGDNYYKIQNLSAQKRAFQRYVDRRPKPGLRLSDAQQQLATTLQRY